MNNWRTTLAGFIGTIGAALLAHNTTKWEWWAGTILSAIAPMLLGMVAKDHNVTGDDNHKTDPTANVTPTDWRSNAK